MEGSGADYAQEFVRTLNTEMDEARVAIAAALQSDPTATVATLETGHHTVLWAPYALPAQATARVGPWWLVYPLVAPEHTSFSRSPRPSRTR